MNKFEKEFDELLHSFQKLEKKYQSILVKDKDDDYADDQLFRIQKCITHIINRERELPNVEDEYAYFLQNLKYDYKKYYEAYQKKYCYVCPYSKVEFEKKCSSLLKELESCKNDLSKFIKDNPKNHYVYICKGLIEEISEISKRYSNRINAVNSDYYESIINDLTETVNRYKQKVKLIHKDQFIAY